MTCNESFSERLGHSRLIKERVWTNNTWSSHAVVQKQKKLVNFAEELGNQEPTILLTDTFTENRRLSPTTAQDLPLPPPRSSSSGGTGGHRGEQSAGGHGGRSGGGHRGKRSRHSGTGHSTSHHENPATTSRSGRSGGGGGGGGDIYYPKYDYDHSKYGRVDASCAYTTKYGEDCRYAEKYHEGGGGDREEGSVPLCQHLRYQLP